MPLHSRRAVIGTTFFLCAIECVALRVNPTVDITTRVMIPNSKPGPCTTPLHARNMLCRMAVSVGSAEAAIPRRFGPIGRLSKMRLLPFRKQRSEKGEDGIPNGTEKWVNFARNPGARARALMWAFLRVLPRLLRARFSRTDDSRYIHRCKGGKAITDALIRLGPTYVKLGQIVSCRKEIPPEYVSALERLQDNVPAFEGNAARVMAEAALGQPLESVFEDFDLTPLAAASLGQVHLATLRQEHGGHKVAVKVQRDNLREMYDLDLALMEKICIALDRFGIKVGGASQRWTDIFHDSRDTLYREIDYRAEADNAMRFHAEFLEVPWVETPEVIRDLCTEKMLVMHYLPGIKISDLEALDNAEGIDRKNVASKLAKAYLLQFCKNGFFNTDPHPGNLAIASSDGEAKIIFYDFGQACELAPNQREGILDIIESIIDLDVKACVLSLDTMGIIEPGSDLAAFENVVAKNFASGKITSPNVKTKPTLDAQAQKAALKEADQASKAVMPYIRMPAEYAFAARAFSQMQGVGKMLDPEFEFIAAAAPGIPEVKGTSNYVKDIISKKLGKITADFKFGGILASP